MRTDVAGLYGITAGGLIIILFVFNKLVSLFQIQYFLLELSYFAASFGWRGCGASFWGAVFGVVFEANHGDQRSNVENVTFITNIFGIILKRTTALSFFSQFGSTVFFLWVSVFVIEGWDNDKL